MRAITAALAVATLALPSSAASAEALRAAVFDLELVDTSLEGEMLGKSDIEAQRLAMLTDRLRTALDASDSYEVLDIAPVREAARGSNLRACGGCDRRFAAELDADVSVTGYVQKVSNLILNINILVRDVETGAMREGHSVDIRSNTDESWTRGLDWLLEHRLLAAEGGQ